MRKRVLNVLLALCMVLCLVLFAGCAQQQLSTAERTEVRNSGTAIQWKYSDESDWHDLVTIAELTGAAGENGADGIDGKDGVNGNDGINGTNGKDGINGTNGVNGKDGKNIEIQKDDLYIRWRYAGGEWQNLVALADISGPAGQNGKTPEFRVNEAMLQWHYVGDEVWLNLYDLSTLKGRDGEAGQDGASGKDGNTPFIGENGNWWIGDTDTGVKATGEKGEKGDTGEKGETGASGKDGNTPFIGENGNWWIGGTDTGVKAAGEKGEKGDTGEKGETGVDGKDGASGKDGNTPFIGENGNWWIGGTDTGVKATGEKGEKGEKGDTGANGKDGSCVGYFSAHGETNSWGKLPLVVKKESGGLISYNSSNNTITLSKGHTYSLVFSGTVAVSANGDDRTCVVALADGYSNDIGLDTQISTIIPKNGQTARLTVAYNTIYTAEENIVLTFQYINMMSMYTDFGGSRYNITIIALN